ncbi:hypothetical protein ACTXT7_009698 [Hymenolepis weldensis]
MLFFKPFKIRKNAALRDTNRKKLVDQVIKGLAISAEDADIIFRGKVATEIKIHTNDRRDVMLYLFDEVPYVFIYEDQLYPTVFLLSSVSSSNVPVTYVYVVPLCAISPESVGSDSKSPRVFSLAICSDSESGVQISKPLAVCVSNSNSKDGSVLHFAKDKLCELCPPHLLQSFKFSEKFSSNSTNPERFLENTEQNDEGTLEDDELSGDNFPKGQNLDIKKTSFKKVNVFLEKMADEGFITLETVPTNIIRIASFRKKHPKLMELLADFPDLEKLMLDDEAQDNSAVKNQQPVSVNVGDFYFGPPTFEEQRIITSRIAPFLASAGYRVDEGIAQSELCRITGSYIDANNLRCSEDRNLINVDNMLMHVSDANLFKETSGSTLADPKYQITFSDLIRSLTRGLKVAYKVTYPPESALSPLYISSGKLPKIKMYEAMQNGKHVTRIGGLYNYGIDMKAFSKYIQTKLACSANLTEDPRLGNAIVVQTQGNHCIALSKLLTETFNLPKQWIDGYQEPVKKGKKKKL